MGWLFANKEKKVNMMLVILMSCVVLLISSCGVPVYMQVIGVNDAPISMHVSIEMYKNGSLIDTITKTFSGNGCMTIARLEPGVYNAKISYFNLNPENTECVNIYWGDHRSILVEVKEEQKIFLPALVVVRSIIPRWDTNQVAGQLMLKWDPVSKDCRYLVVIKRWDGDKEYRKSIWDIETNVLHIDGVNEKKYFGGDDIQILPGVYCVYIDAYVGNFKPESIIGMYMGREERHIKVSESMY